MLHAKVWCVLHAREIHLWPSSRSPICTATHWVHCAHGLHRTNNHRWCAHFSTGGSCASSASARHFLFDFSPGSQGSLEQPLVPQRSLLCLTERWVGRGIQSIKGQQRRWTLSQHDTGKWPPKIPPELWKKYLHWYCQQAWWVGDIGGNHPNYPGFPLSSQRDNPTLSWSSSLLPSTSLQSDCHSPL